MRRILAVCALAARRRRVDRRHPAPRRRLPVSAVRHGPRAQLISIDAGKPAGQSTIVAEGLMAAGRLGRSLLRQAFGDGGKPWFVCTVTASAGCVRSVAVDGARWLDDPAGSADGKRVAFVRGRDLYVVSAASGSARRLARNVSSPGVGAALSGAAASMTVNVLSPPGGAGISGPGWEG
jgi:hypothetical protein